WIDDEEQPHAATVVRATCARSRPRSRIVDEARADRAAGEPEVALDEAAATTTATAARVVAGGLRAVHGGHPDSEAPAARTRVAHAGTAARTHAGGQRFRTEAAAAVLVAARRGAATVRRHRTCTADRDPGRVQLDHAARAAAATARLRGVVIAV